MKSNPLLAKGFTIIELLVVIAIIGILSSVVLASVNTARTKALDAKVKTQMATIRTAAENYFSTNGNYGSAVATNGDCSAGVFFTDAVTGMKQLTVSLNYPETENTIVCDSSGTAYAVQDNLSDGLYWCVDSSGNSRASSTALASTTNATVCP